MMQPRGVIAVRLSLMPIERHKHASELDSATVRFLPVRGGPVASDRADRIARAPLAEVGRMPRRNRGVRRWLAVAILTGALAALAFVTFLAR